MGLLAGAGALPGHGQASGAGRPDGFVDILRPPDRVYLHASAGETELTRAGGHWRGAGLELSAEPRRAGSSSELPISIAAPGAELEYVCLRWLGKIADTCRFLGDHWERSYGDLEWRGSVPHRLMPWYFLLHDGEVTHGYGVKTGAAAICCWQADPDGVSLWLDLRNGGMPVRPGDRVVQACTVVAVRGEPGKSAFQSACALCHALSEHPRLPAAPVYGGNNWYYTYGRNFAAPDIVRDSEVLAELAPAGESNRPFMVIDMGWSQASEGAGPVERTAAGFPDMAGLAAKMKKTGVRPGIWIRPLLTVESLAETWRMPANSFSGSVKPPFFIMDPSVPEVLEHVRASVRVVTKWGFELIKHDYSTFDIFGRWGFQMDARLTNPGWHFADRSRTSAEIVLAFYCALREAAGDALLLGCNTIGHLGAGLFEVQRIGDDTSGREWERTRKMGVNTLAFRLPQHATFFAADADCVPVTAAIPWKMTAQWLDLVARSGTPLFVSADPKACGAEQKRALQAAFARAARPQPQAEPLGWMDTAAPERWQFGEDRVSYSWYGATNASPFAI